MNFSLALLFSFISTLIYSTISIFIGKAAQKHGAYWTSFWIQVLGLPLTLLFLPVFGVNLSLNLYILPIFLFGLGGFFSFILYSKNLSIGPVSVVQAVMRLSNLITFILAILFLSESINIIKTVGATLLIIGAIMVSLDIRELMQRKIQVMTKAVPLSLLQAFINGISFIFLTIAIKHFDGFSANVAVRLIIASLFLLTAISQSKPKHSILKNSGWLLLFIAAGDVVAFILFTFSVQIYQISFASMMQSTIPVMTALIASIRFHEKLRLAQKIGIVLTVAGSIFLIGSS